MKVKTVNLGCNVGDVVMLSANGPRMTNVENDQVNARCRCAWFDQKRALHTAWFPHDGLRLIKSRNK